METVVHLAARDGVSMSGYLAGPIDTPKGGVIVLQELFGVNDHIRKLCRDFAALGYVALAPALFDRVRQGVELGYDMDAVQTGIALRDQLPLDDTLADIQASVDMLRAYGRVGVVGYCWGGTLTFLSAARLSGIAAAVGYYGSKIPDFRDEAPKVPLMLHFAADDHTLPADKVASVMAARPEAQIFIYDAGHGFNCDVRPSFHAVSAELALSRTLELFAAEVSSD